MEASEATELELLNYWNDSSAYTKIVLGHGQPDSILHKVARTLRLEYYTEYWNIDAVFYDKSDGNYSQKAIIYAEQLTIALEHENDSGGAFEEMYKLSTYNSPLKVLITYASPGKQPDRLKDYKEILKKSDIFFDFATLRKHLVIFGSRSGNKVNWTYHIWDGEDFKDIKPSG